MTSHHTPHFLHDDDEAAEVLEAGGQELDLSARRERVRLAVEAHRQAEPSAASRPLRHFAATVLAAAAAVLILSILSLRQPTLIDGIGIGLVESDVAWSLEGVAIDPADGILAGTLIQSNSGRAEIHLGPGRSLRLDNNTSLRIDGLQRLELEHGRIYVDANATGPGVEITTRAGTVLEVGTQFLVELDDSMLRVAVREGRVELTELDGDALLVDAGSMVEISDQQIETRPIAATASDFAWAVALAPVPDIDDMALLDFLDWASRELGVKASISNAATQERASAIHLHGSVAGLTPTEAIAAIDATIPLRLTLEVDRLLLSEK